MVGKFKQDVSSLLSYFVKSLFSVIQPAFEIEYYFCRLTLWWGEMNLIGQFFLAGSPGCKNSERVQKYVRGFSTRTT